MKLALLNTELIKVIVQASPEYRAERIFETLKNDRDEMVHYSAFMKLEKYMDQRLLDIICTLLQRLVVLLLKKHEKRTRHRTTFLSRSEQLVKHPTD
jgi:hypothetical protein